MMAVGIILSDNNESDETKALRTYESIYLLNELCQFQKKDQLSEHYQGQSIEDLMNILKRKTIKSEETLNFESDLIEKYLGVKNADGLRVQIKDVFYRTFHGVDAKRNDIEVNYEIDFLKKVVNKYEPKALIDLYNKKESSDLTLSDYKDLAKNKIESMGFLKNEAVDYNAFKEALESDNEIENLKKEIKSSKIENAVEKNKKNLQKYRYNLK